MHLLWQGVCFLSIVSFKFVFEVYKELKTKNLNEKLNIEERNESSANFKNIPFSNYFKQDIATGFFILVVIS